MEASEAIATQVLARFNADSGTGGLMNSASGAFVRQLFRDGDTRERGIDAWPRVVVSVNARELGVPTSQTTTEGFDGVVRFRIITDRDRGFGPIDRVESRIRDRFLNATLSSLVDTDDAARTWKFAPMGRLTPTRDQMPSPTGKLLVRDAVYRVLATKGST